MAKRIDAARVLELSSRHGTPFYVYDAAVIREQVASLRAFDVIRYAQKACSNVHILRLLRAEGCLVDAVSLGEIERALRAGFDGAGNVAAITPAGVYIIAGGIEAFCRNHQIIALAGDQFPQNRLRLAFAVGVRAIEEVDT